MGVSFPGRTAPMHDMLIGAVAGAAGTAILNATTYADMAVRGRPPSKVPEETVRRLLRLAGADRLALPPGEADPPTRHRQRGMGALTGYGVGIGYATVYGVLRARGLKVPWTVAALVLGFGTMATTDTIATLLEVENPERRDAGAWLADIVPHLVYGIVTAAAVEALAG